MNSIKRNLKLDKVINTTQSSRFDKYDVIVYWLLCGALVYLLTTVVISVLTKTVMG